ncbi:MAG TPA: amino acid permease [Planctomycetaceae bacterium]|nr:amino acid permease [Planctomycetaceae bacterium]
MAENRDSTIDPSPLAPGMESRPGLLRALGPGMAVALVVGNVIGSGIFFKPGGIAADVGDFRLIITAWIVGGLVCVLGGLCFAELGAMLPRAGGLYVYLREAYGRPTAFLFGWTEFAFGKPASNAALSVAFVGALDAAVGWDLPIFAVVALAAAVVSGMAWVNILGVIWGGRLQAGTTLIKAGFLGVVALLPFVMLAFGGTPAFNVEHYGTTLSSAPKQSTTLAQFAAAMLAVMWAYNGWHGITPVAEEIRDPERNIPRALFLGIGILIVLYVGANFAYHGVLSMDEMAAGGTHAAQNMVRKSLAAVSEPAAGVGVALVTAVIMTSTFGAINSNILEGPRVSFAMGRDDVFFRGLGRVHVNYRTPAVAIAVQALMAAGLLAATWTYVRAASESRGGDERTSHVEHQTSNIERSASDAGSTAPDSGSQLSTLSSQLKTNSDLLKDAFTILTNLVVFSASLFYFLAVLAVIVLRVRRPDWRRPYRAHGYPLVPLLYLAFYTVFLWYVYRDQRLEANVGLVLVALGLPAYFGWRAWAARHPEDVSDGA